MDPVKDLNGETCLFESVVSARPEVEERRREGRG